MCYLRRFFYYIKYNIWKFGIKAKFSRAFKGYDTSDLWNMNWYLADLISRMLKELRENRCGHPSNIADEEWGEILKRMAEGFEYFKKDHMTRIYDERFNNDDFKKTIEIVNKETKLNKKKMYLFIKYFENLWD